MEEQEALEGQSRLERQKGQGPLDTPNAQTTAIVATPKPIWRRVFETLQDALCGILRFSKKAFVWTTTWFMPRVLAVFLALILFGGWIQVEPFKRMAASWLHPLERMNARSWCQSGASGGFISRWTPYPPNEETPSVRIAPWLWCNAHSPTKGVAFKMKKLFPHLG